MFKWNLLQIRFRFSSECDLLVCKNQFTFAMFADVKSSKLKKEISNNSNVCRYSL